jgi:hypothetical protein
MASRLRSGLLVLHGPAGERVLPVEGDAAQGPGLLRRQAGVQFGNKFQVDRQHPQLGGGAQFELAAFVDVQRLVGGVGLHAHLVALGCAFEQGEAVAHRAQRAGLQQALADQALAARELGVAQAPEVAAHRVLQGGVDRGVEADVEPVEVVERGAQPAGQAAARGGRALARAGGQLRRLAGHVAEHQPLPQGGVAPAGVDEAFGGQQPQVGVGGPVELLAALCQVPGRPPVRHHECHHLPQHLGPLGRVGREPLGGRQQRPRALEVGPEPHPQAVAQPVHLAMARRRRQRHGVQVVQQDLAPHRQRVGTLPVGAHRGRRHLAQLFAGILREAIGRVAVLFDLGGQGAAAGAVHVGVDAAGQLAQHRAGEAHPVDRRVHLRPVGVEQVAVLDEHQGLGHQRRHLLEALECPVRVAEAVDRLAVAVQHGQAGPDLFGKWGVQTAVQIGLQLRALTRLFGDHETARRQPGHHIRDGGVAQPLVERAVGRKTHLGTCARGGLVRQTGGVTAEEPGLQAGRLGLVHRQPAHRRARQQQRRTDPHQAPGRAPSAPRQGGHEAGFFGQGGLHLLYRNNCGPSGAGPG